MEFGDYVMDGEMTDDISIVDDKIPFSGNIVDKSCDYHKFMINRKEITVNDEQYKIITSPIDTNQLVLACAGSGKSTTMVCRIKYLIDNGIKPERIILTTFNVDACESLRQKVSSLFNNVPKIMIGTFDSISCRLYHRYFEQTYSVGINEYTTELIKYLQTDDGKVLIKSFDYLVFDEFQDVNDFQYQVIQIMYDNGVKVILIGDDAQNIYQWRGSNIKYILNAKQYFPNIQIQYLSINYRSSEEIVNFANAIICKNKDCIVKQMFSNIGKVQIKPCISHYYNLGQQSDSVLWNITKLLCDKEKITDPNDIAVISRNGIPLKNFEEYLERHNKKNPNSKISYISLLTTEGSDAKPKIKDGCVTLTTIHKAKGLEWKYVFFINCEDDTIPSNLDDVGIQEERRLFYVAITRAKTNLWMSFTKNTVSRFIGAISSGLYNFSQSKPEYFKYSERRVHAIDDDLDHIMCSLNEHDIKNMRDLGIIPKYNIQTEKINDTIGYIDVIEKDFLHKDLSNFIGRYAMRCIGDILNDDNCYFDVYANSLIKAITVSRDEYNEYARYKDIFDTISHQNVESYVATHIPNSYKLSNIIGKIKNREDDENTINFVFPEKYLPEEFRRELKPCYSDYVATTKMTNDIVKSIYNISLCENICYGRRRMIYMNLCDVFINEHKMLMHIINEKFIIPYILKSGEYVCNKRLIMKNNKLRCNLFVCDICNKTIFEMRCSNETECKLEWVLQILGKVSMLYELSDGKIVMTTIKIYNPIQGLLMTIDIGEWVCHIGDALIKYVCSARNIPYFQRDQKDVFKIQLLANNHKIDKKTQINKTPNKDININMNITKDMSDVIKMNDMLKTKKIVDNILRYDNLLGSYSKLSDEMSNILRMMRVCEHEIKYREIINNNSGCKKPYYMVLDTETTGLPQQVRTTSTHDDNETLLRAYDTARILQLCWCCYDIDGRLIKVNNYYIKPNGYEVGATHIHGITKEIAERGDDFKCVVKILCDDLDKIKIIFGHNIKFDVGVLKSEMMRCHCDDGLNKISNARFVCTMNSCKKLVGAKNKRGHLKYPTQSELYECVLNRKMNIAHNAKFDVLNLGEVVSKLIKRHIIFFD